MLPRTSVISIIIVVISLVHIQPSLSQSFSIPRLLQTSTYVTSSTRGPTVRDQCDHTSRSQLYQEYGISAEISHSSSVGDFFDFDMQIVDYVLDEQWDKVRDQLHTEGGRLFVYYGAWLIGLAVTILIWPFLICCMCRGDKCPMFCTRKPQKMPYSNCELKWPALATILLFLIVLTASIIGISSKYKAGSGYDDAACAGGIFLDDLANGNVSYYDSGMFFTGIRTLDTELRQMNDDIIALNVQMAKLGSAAVGVIDAQTQIASSKVLNEQVPSITGDQLVLTYAAPLQSSTPSTTIDSTFPSVLGTIASSQSLVGKAYISLQTYEQLVTNTSTSADQYTLNIPAYTAAIDTSLNSTNKTAREIQQEDIQFNDFVKENNSETNSISIGQYVIYGAAILQSFLGIIAVTMLVWCNRSGCRFFLYFLCVWLFFLCLIAFLYCLAASVLNPIAYYSCEYMQQNIESQTKLQSTLIDHFDIQAQVASNISHCVALDGDGQFVKNVVGDDVFNSLQYLNSTYNYLKLINIANSTILKSHQDIIDRSQEYRNAQITDITDSDALTQLSKLSKASQYSCSASGFSSDSWVPSNNQLDNKFPCQISNGNSSDSTTCTSSANFISRAAGCVGCMDTYNLFENNNSKSDVQTILDSRYADASCGSFTTQLSNVWEHYYDQKTNAIGPVETRAGLALTQADTTEGTMTYFEDIKTNIDTGFSDMVHEDYGVLNGLNCKIVGEDARLLRQVFCENVFVYTFFVRVIFGIISFALLFLLCCIVCVGRRNQRQQQFDNGGGKNQQKYKQHENDDLQMGTGQKLYNPNQNQDNNYFNNNLAKQQQNFNQPSYPNNNGGHNQYLNNPYL